jgi:hypothetical protein
MRPFAKHNTWQVPLKKEDGNLREVKGYEV